MAPDAAPAATLALAFTAGLAVALLVTRLSSRRQRPPGRVPPPKRRHEDTTRFKIVKPPLPAEVVGLLRSTSLCHLSTQGNDGGPHLSLMRFTYVQAEEKILISTRRNTAKFEYLSQNPSVALLVHDFPHLGAGCPTLTLTLTLEPKPKPLNLALPLTLRRGGGGGRRGGGGGVNPNPKTLTLGPSLSLGPSLGQGCLGLKLLSLSLSPNLRTGAHVQHHAQRAGARRGRRRCGVLSGAAPRGEPRVRAIHRGSGHRHRLRYGGHGAHLQHR
uniref:Pyridoxamine 5'-phosphate oxidase N-terminal domain-containing protein n=1 Tax=Phaeomonas parva TaxID=124430 RepID=A0A7S1U2P2_9STRA